jgi:hypothetical protein
LLLLWLSGRKQAVDLAKNVAPRSLFDASAIGWADCNPGSGSRIENAMSHAVLPP